MKPFLSSKIVFYETGSKGKYVQNKSTNGSAYSFNRQDYNGKTIQ